MVSTMQNHMGAHKNWFLPRHSCRRQHTSEASKILSIHKLLNRKSLEQFDQATLAERQGWSKKLRGLHKMLTSCSCRRVVQRQQPLHSQAKLTLLLLADRQLFLKKSTQHPHRTARAVQPQKSLCSAPTSSLLKPEKHGKRPQLRTWPKNPQHLLNPKQTHLSTC